MVGCETVVEGFCAGIMEPASELRTIEVRRFPALSEEERAMCRHLGTVLIRVVPPKPFGPL